MEELKLKYLIADIECLEDYFSLQLKSEDMTNVMIFECYNDKNIQNLYSQVLCKISRPMYVYSIDYDKVMLNTVCKLVESNITNLNYHLRKVNDYIIKHKLNYFRLNTEFWCNNYFKFKQNDSTAKHKELFNRSKNQFSGIEYQFIDEYPMLLGQSKVFKNLTINSIPKIYWYFNINKEREIQMNISLKKLQLIHEGYNVKFDFFKYTTIATIKKDNLYEEWIKYSKNDVLFLEKLFLARPKEEIEKRWYAYQAVKTINSDFKITNNILYSENNTNLIVEVLKLPEDKINKNFDIDYTQYIKTNYDKFNNFVKFVNENKHIKQDGELRKIYQNQYSIEIEDDSKNIVNEIGQVGTQINSIDEIEISNEINNIKIKFGFGGAHGALNNYIGENLLHLDYDSQYPSIILQFQELFKNIINIELYRAIYHLRMESKPQLKENPDNKILQKIVIGLKLILNSATGLINSNFNLPISCKTYGRFITLFGQSLLINLCDKVKECTLINVNTDGIILKQQNNYEISIPAKGYFKLGITKMNNLIQKDVNNYIRDDKVKGCYNLSIKQYIAKNEKLAVNTSNALRLLNNNKIEIKPIYFDPKWFPEKADKAWYFTDMENGEIIIKQVKKPEILSINGENIYFTEDKNKVKSEFYLKYAEIVKNQIINFEFGTGKSKNNLFYQEKLEPDTNKNNIEKRTIKRQLNKIFGSTKVIGLVGYGLKNKQNSYINNQPIKPLIHYTMTEIQNSTYCTGFSIENNKFNSKNPFLIIDIDIYDKNTGTCKKNWNVVSEFITQLKKSDTFQCWNNKTIKYNRKFIFKSSYNQINEIKLRLQELKWNNYIEILNKATIFTIADLGNIKYETDFKELQDFKLTL